MLERLLKVASPLGLYAEEFGTWDKKSVSINSQLISCTASEVAAMIVEGAMHHRTEMAVQANDVDSHG